MQQVSRVATAQRGVSHGLTLGLDLGDRVTHFALLDVQGTVIERGNVGMTREALRERFAKLQPSRVVLEVSTHSPWVSALFGQLGHAVIVANARAVKAVSQNPRKSDRVDAELLARLGRVDPELLHPLQHRGEAAQRDLAVLRARDTLVRARSMLISSTRGLVKASGERLPECDADAFARHAAEALPTELRPALEPLLNVTGTLTQQLRGYDREIAAMLMRHPAARLLQQARGVGPITALAYVLTIDDPQRFARSRMVGPYLGLVPGGASRAAATPSCILRKPATPSCGSCSSSVRTTCSARSARTVTCGAGDCGSPARAPAPASAAPSSPWRASSRCCCTTSG